MANGNGGKPQFWPIFWRVVEGVILAGVLVGMRFTWATHADVSNYISEHREEAIRAAEERKAIAERAKSVAELLSLRIKHIEDTIITATHLAVLREELKAWVERKLEGYPPDALYQRIDRLEGRVDKGFERVDERFDKLDAKRKQ